ncbi:MAG: hypothetical protein HFG35_07325 [Eubacterium sp.]|jgi:hypothetical protein|nr:hypothetical protein [Eubacterium sp.]
MGNTFKNSVGYFIQKHSIKECIILILQISITITILTLAVLGLDNILPITTTNTVDLVLLALLCIICGIRFIPNRIVYAVIYFVVAAVICGVFIASFFL